MEHQTQARCPYCRSSEGYLRRVTLWPGERMFTFTCADCHRTWNGEPHSHETTPSQSLGAGPQPENIELLRSTEEESEFLDKVSFR